MITTGDFSLIGVQDAVINESIYKRTAQNVKPETPVSDPGKIPEGWSATMLDVSASFPYLWESQRTRTEIYTSNDISNAVLVHTGYRISNTGNIVTDASYAFSDFIKLSKGQVIEVNTAGKSLSAISLSNGSTTSFTPVKTLDNTVPQVCTYLADEDCEVVVCVKITSAYSVKIYTASYGAWSTPTLKNSWGKQGAKMRMRSWSSDTEYLSGADGEEFYDVVVYNDKLYLCTKTHTSESGTNDPVTSINGYLGFWESAQEWTFVATKLLLAEKIKASQIDADGIKAKNVDIEGKITATSGMFSGDINIGNGANKISQDGSGSLAKGNISWDSAGNLTLAKDVRFEGFVKPASMTYAIIEKNGLYTYILDSKQRGNFVMCNPIHDGDLFALPRGEQWNGTYLYVYNFSNTYSLIVGAGKIPPLGAGLFWGSALLQSNPSATMWTTLAISKSDGMLGIIYEDYNQ
nr:MAG TPA: hypothetical protein [Caudoviricetes sp.]